MIQKFFQILRKYSPSSIEQKHSKRYRRIRMLSDADFETRAKLKRSTNKPINVVFVCHEPSLWSMFESIYNSMAGDSGFCPLVAAMHYRHPNLSDGQYNDTGILQFCESRKIQAVQGYDKIRNEWLDPTSLMPDYVFFQTPYNIFPSKWSVESLSSIARICYIPYATCLFKGEVDDILHPTSFFEYVRFVFKESPLSYNLFLEKFQKKDWLNKAKIILCGHPKLDYLNDNNNHIGKMFRRGMRNDITRILWTPRWNTSEGNCHFFDYKDFFFSFCREHQDVDFTFRPHPLWLQNFIRTGELTESDFAQIEVDFDNSQNMNLDRGADYHDTFFTCDILVSDISSMMLEYFGTGNPIVYTHRIDVFNELGRRLSEGFYWVNNATELKATLEMLILGNDPLRDKRKELAAEVLFLPKGGSGLYIKELIRADFYENIS